MNTFNLVGQLFGIKRMGNSIMNADQLKTPSTIIYNKDNVIECDYLRGDTLCTISQTYGLGCLNYQYLLHLQDEKKNDIVLFSNIDANSNFNGPSSIVISNNYITFASDAGFIITMDQNQISVEYYDIDTYCYIYSLDLKKCRVVDDRNHTYALYEDTNNFYSQFDTDDVLMHMVYGSLTFKYRENNKVLYDTYKILSDVLPFFKQLKLFYDQLIKYKNMPIIHAVYSKQIENEIKKTQNCVVCMVNQREMVFVPCGHFATCNSCSDKLKICSICNKSITNKTKLYIP